MSSLLSQFPVKPKGTSLHFENGRLGAISDGLQLKTAWTFPQLTEIMPGNQSQMEFAKRSVAATGEFHKIARETHREATVVYRNLYCKENPGSPLSFVYRHFPKAVPRNPICMAVAMAMAGFGVGYAYAKS